MCTRNFPQGNGEPDDFMRCLFLVGLMTLVWLALDLWTSDWRKKQTPPPAATEGGTKAPVDGAGTL